MFALLVIATLLPLAACNSATVDELTGKEALAVSAENLGDIESLIGTYSMTFEGQGEQVEFGGDMEFQFEPQAMHMDMSIEGKKLDLLMHDSTFYVHVPGEGWFYVDPEALELIKKAIALMPDDPQIIDSLGWVYYRMGDMDKALEHLREAYAAKPDVEIAAHLGEVLWTTGARDEAMKVWREASGREPKNEVLRGTLARLNVSL